MNLFAAGSGRVAARVLAGLAVAATAGCATPPGAGGPHASNPKDPYETFNRKVFAFNDTLDTYALKPVATAYTKVVPSPLRTGVHNFFGNFSDAWSAVNQLLQGKPDDSARMTMRVLTNTIIGVGGLFDPATPMGLERKAEDLGQTLGRWGAEPGPYLVLPLFGPSDVRDALALPADTYVSPALLVDTTWQKVGVDTLGVVDTRANLLGATQMLDDIALDRYSFLRDAYVARRRSLVYDGNPPDEPRSDDDDDVGPTMPAAPAPRGTGLGGVVVAGSGAGARRQRGAGRAGAAVGRVRAVALAAGRRDSGAACPLRRRGCPCRCRARRPFRPRRPPRRTPDARRATIAGRGTTLAAHPVTLPGAPV